MVILPWWWWQWVPSDQPQGKPAFWRWFHAEHDPVTTGNAAVETAKNGSWMHLDLKARARQFRALIIVSLQAARLSWRPAGRLGELNPDLYSTQERNAAGSALARTFMVLTPPSIRPTSDIHTEEAEPASTFPFETGVLSIPLIVVLIIAAAIAAAYLAAAVDGIHFDNELTKRLLSAHGRAVEVIAHHVERERIAGRELPFTDLERQLLLELEDQQRMLATMQRRPLPAPFKGAAEFVRAPFEGAGEFVQQTATSLKSLLPLLLVALMAYVLLSSKSQEA